LLLELEQCSDLNQQHNSQSQHTTRPDPAVFHRLKASRSPRSHTISGIHQPVVMQTATKPDADCDHKWR
jgi:hypothetical protein